MNMHVNACRRAAIERQIEELIDLLDAPDLEPSLGWPEAHGLAQVSNIQLHDDREDENELLEDGGDTEPNGDETDYDGGENDFPGFIAGGHGL